MIVVPISYKVHLTVVLQTFCCGEDGVDTMAKVDVEIKPLPHSHRVKIVVFNWFQIGIACLHVQAVLIDDIAAQLPIRGAHSALGIAEG